jgi:hypothetical protein
MRKSKIEQSPNALLDAIAQIENQNQSENKLISTNVNSNIVDVITFCNSPDYLNLPGQNFNLYMSQRVILKTFYMGSRGNEKQKLIKEEWEWLYSHEESEERDEVVYEKNAKEVIKKILEREKLDKPKPFKELHLVMGRRSGKTSLASIISAYEVYKLLVINNGDPHKFYNLPEDDEIAVINVALSLSQAGKLFNDINTRLRNSKFFTGRIAKSTTSEIRLYTDMDLKKNKILKDKGSLLTIPGSILVLCGHSNPDTLAGKSAILILFDELAHYDESGKVTGSYFYNRLKPSLAKFLPKGDGRLVEISSPDTESGIFYDISKLAKDNSAIISYQLPTWCANAELSYEDLESDRKRNPDVFAIEYGAQWAKGGVYGNYFPQELIERCIRLDISPHMRPQRGFNYYLHIDPAKKCNRYVALLVAKEYYQSRNKRRVRVHLANIWIWEPKPGIGLLFNEIDKQVINICALFHPMTVSYDQYNSEQSMQLLKSHGINVVEVSYNRSFKNKIYQNLKDLMSYQPDSELWIYDDTRLILELKHLKYRPTMRGVSLMVDKHGEVSTDDLCDSLAGAVAMASESIRAPLPSPVVVRAWGPFGMAHSNMPINMR